METPVEPVREAVVVYFATIEQIQPGQMGDDAYDMVNKISEALARADTSGLDGLIEDPCSKLQGMFDRKECGLFCDSRFSRLNPGENGSQF